MRHRLISAVAVVAVAALLPAACGGDDDSGGNAGGSSSSEFGTGLKLGAGTGTAKVGASVAPWYVWNADKCAFEKTDDHPAEYKAETRKIEGDAPRLGYMHYGNTDPFGVAVSKSIESEAKAAGMDVNVYNLKFPSRTEPQSVANTSVTKQDDVVVQANLDPTVLPEFFKIIEGKGCAPSIQLFIPIDDHPGMGNNWPDVGDVIGKYIAEQATERGWKPEDTALVQCTDRDSGPTVNIMFDYVPKAMKSGGFEVPKDNVFNIVCGLTDPQSGYKKITDWYTGHPDFKHAAFSAIDSIRSVEMARAIKDEGRPKSDSILAAGADDASSRASVRAGGQDMSVAFFGEKFGTWIVPMVEDILAGNPVPSFVGTELIPLTAENVDEYYP
ncbi:MAG TPA: substrate-binding domain-containing protein, partial [Beijerinckiaceae bacterium]|nr:substrate-binding domain-containing protein [Beijerinckiaceae bacterium]